MHSSMNQPNHVIQTVMVLEILKTEIRAMHALRFVALHSLTASVVEIPMVMVGQIQPIHGKPTPMAQQTHSRPNRFNGEIQMAMVLVMFHWVHFEMIAQQLLAFQCEILKAVLTQMVMVGQILMVSSQPLSQFWEKTQQRHG